MIANRDTSSSPPLRNSGKRRKPGPKELANLRPFPKGVSGNPDGRPSAGMSIREYMNEMQAWTKAELRAVIQDEKAAVNRISAARLWLEACMNSNDLDRIMDRTEGKPNAAIQVDHTTGGKPFKILAGVDEELI